MFHGFSRGMCLFHSVHRRKTGSQFREIIYFIIVYKVDNSIVGMGGVSYNLMYMCIYNGVDRFYVTVY